MNRLTNKKVLDTMSKFPKDYTFSSEELIYIKLGQYEDIEEEFDIDLIKILTAKEVYTFGTEVVAPGRLGRTNKIVKCYSFDFNFVKKIIYIHVPKVGLYGKSFLEYGKSWAFTKEELEK